MKVSVVIPSFYPAVVYGGPIFTSLHTAEELAKLGIEVRVSTTNANMTTRLDCVPNTWGKKSNNFFIKYYNETFINKFSLSLLLNVWKDIKNTDVIHIQGLFSTPIPIALIYASIFNKSVLLTPHGTLGKWCLSGGNKFKHLWLKFLIKPFNSTTVWHATAEMEKNEILAIFPEANIKVIPNGVNIKEFQNPNILSKNQFMQKFTGEALEASNIIISMGRIQKKKGLDILINAFVKILKNRPKCKLVIAGPDEGEKASLEKQILNLNLLNKVFLINPIKGQDKVDFLANADLFVLPSHNENFGIVYVESLAAGTPIVASKNTPWAEVETANCGKWVNNSIDETADAVLEMLKKDRNIMRTNSKSYAEEYNWGNIALKFKKDFELIIKASNE